VHGWIMRAATESYLARTIGAVYSFFPRRVRREFREELCVVGFVQYTGCDMEPREQSLFAVEARNVARVALPVPIDEAFEYSVPAALELRAQPGCRVQVRFRERRLTGVIIERADRAEFQGRLLPIEFVIDDEPVLSRSMLKLLTEAADEVLCPIGIAMATALPAGSAPRTTVGYRITPRGLAALESGAVGREVGAVLESLTKTPRSLTQLNKLTGEAGLVAQLARDGLVVKTGLDRSASARVATIRTASVAPGVEVERICDSMLARAPKQAALLRRLAKSDEVATTALNAEFPAASSLLARLAERGLVRMATKKAPRDVLGKPLAPDRPVELTADQASCVKPIAEAVRERRAETFLLHGVTGSGKTEVYLRAVGEALAMGRQALVLVPEITLTHQILARLRGRFGDELAVLHSGLRPGERLEQWERLRAGATPIAVGARSALFAPLENLGVIVMDEEHDSAYKNEEGFRYHARRLATLRAEAAGCPIILGSATPAVDTRFAADRGEIQRLVLGERVGGRPLPGVELVDLVRERDRSVRGRRVILSITLRRAIDQALGDSGQVILFLNRRGFSTTILCFDCGAAERCQNCDISLVYHASEQRLRCHYCDYAIPPPEHCSNCGAPDSALLGVGTERLEEEVRSLYPKARIARLDRDTAAKRGHTESVLRGLGDRSIDILIGTQMVAKGHDFPGVRLVGVVAADVGLHLPDFRASERTFQLLTQVAGRAGRDELPGRVIIQSFDPGHYAIQPVIDHDYERFYAEELGHRSLLGYPPFGRLVRALITGPDEDATFAVAKDMTRDVIAALGAHAADLDFLGPAPAPLKRLRRRFRYQLLIKGPAGRSLRLASESLVAATNQLVAPIQASVDVDPVSML
jgi:primosomal protein N' (replication factor Y)